MRTCAGVLAYCLVCAVSSYPSIRVIENSAKRLTFEWTTSNLRISQVSKSASSVAFSGANADLGDNGEPVVPAVSLHFGVPPQGVVSVRLASTATHVETLSNPLRVRSAPGTGPRYPGLRFTNPWISNAMYTRYGRLRGAQFILRPISYQKDGRTLQVLDKAEITVEFPPYSGSRGVSSPAQSDYANMLRRLILNYSVAGGWTVAAPLAKRAATTGYPLQAADTLLSFAIGDGHSGFNEGTINENGIIKLRGSDIIRLLGSPIPIGRVALFASYKGELPVATSAPDQIPNGLSEVPMARFDVNGNGIVDSSDYFLAYVSSISDWKYDTAAHRFSYQIDHYDDYRHYWIAKTDTALSLTKMAAAPAQAPVITSFENHVLFKKSVWPILSETNGGLQWAWQRFSSSVPSFTISSASIDTVLLPNADPAEPCSLQVILGPSSPSMTVSYGGSSVCAGCQYGAWFPFTYSPGNTMTFTANVGNDTIELDQMEVRCWQKLDMTNRSSMTIFSPEGSGMVRYQLSGLPADLVYILRIGNCDASMMLVDTVRGGGTYQWTDTAGIGVRYYVCTQQGIGSSPVLSLVGPRTSSPYTVRDLRSISAPVDYLVVTHPNFILSAQVLAREKKSIGQFANPVAMSISDIYGQFSGGNTDPSALRNCLEYVRENVRSQWNVSFDYVVLMGSGHYDYRNIATQDTSFMPVAEFNGLCIEDYFVYLDPGDTPDNTASTPDCFLGRIPCKTSQDASQVVNKIIQMENPSSNPAPDFGAWRNCLLLVNDDDMQGTQPDPLGTQHLESSELIDTVVEHLRPAINVEKVNEFEYPFDGQLEKPEAKQALLNDINNGVAFVNYFGHGSPIVWADEHIFMPDDIVNLHNNGQYPMISSFSCSVGMFDQPGLQCLSACCVLAHNSGAISTVSATREAFSTDNEQLAQNFFTFAFDTSDTAARTIGEALALAKAVVQDQNEQIYSYLGDPSIQLMRPSRRVSLTVTDNKGTPLNDTLKALEQVTIRGTIIKKDGTVDTRFSAGGGTAKVQLSMFNPAYLATRKDNGIASNPSYKMPGTPIFAGQTQVTNGAFQQSILLPKNVTFNTPGVRLTAYAWIEDSVALGCRSSFLFHGFASAKITDTVGPSISVRPVYQGGAASSAAPSSTGASSTDKISATLPVTLEILMFDSSGIDAVSTGPNEGITFEVPGVIARTNIDSKFQFAQGDYRRGTADWMFDAGAMTPGPYTINITAQDLLGNVAKRSVTFEVTTDQALALYHVFTYPNPMRMGQGCSFYYDLSKTVTQTDQDKVVVAIRLFTLSGRLVRVINDAKRGEPFDGKDAFGNKLSPGVYLYQIYAVDQLNQQVVKSPIEKLAINPPR